MSIFGVIALLITLAAIFGFLNERTLRLPTAIGVTLSSLVLSLGLLLVNHVGVGLELGAWAERVIGQIEFDELLMEGMLSFLLFAGSLHVDLSHLRRQKMSILVLATVGVVVSTFLVGTVVWWGLALIGEPIPYIWALVFGSLISPTDPIAVLGILKQAKTPRPLETLITGESLFNDGVGVVVFLVLSGLAAGGDDLAFGAIAELFLTEAVGGLLFGVALGLAAYWLLKQVDDYTVEVLITLAVVTGGYAVAGAFHLSGPLAMVAAGLFLGNHGRTFAMTTSTREHLDTFWEMLDEILNALLFVLIGLEVLIVPLSPAGLAIGLAAVPVVLSARLLAVGGTINLLRLRYDFLPYTVRMMTWGGLRGGISIALALSLPAVAERGLIVGMTYVVVVFSILVQGLTVGKLASRVRQEVAKSATPAG